FLTRRKFLAVLIAVDQVLAAVDFGELLPVGRALRLIGAGALHSLPSGFVVASCDFHPLDEVAALLQVLLGRPVFLVDCLTLVGWVGGGHGSRLPLASE